MVKWREGVVTLEVVNIQPILNPADSSPRTSNPRYLDNPIAALARWEKAAGPASAINACSEL